MRKFDIVNRLVSQYRLTKYLEIATPTTGLEFDRVDRGALELRHRVMSHCANDFDDGLEITYKVHDQDLRSSIKLIHTRRIGYDIVFVDPYHTYEDSWEAISGAVKIVAPGGFVVIHDCNPPSAELARPEFMEGDWCGVTYLAYLDFVTGNTRLEYLTVDTDFGCGVIRKPARQSVWKAISSVIPADLGKKANRRRKARRWRQRPIRDFDAAYTFFDRDRDNLLNLVTPEEFEAKLLS